MTVRSLYFKIFLWFWLAMALVGIAFVISTATLQSSEAEARWRSFVASGLTLSGQSAVEAYRTRGGEGLAQYFERMERRADIRGYLFDAGLRELSGRPLPEGAVELASIARDGDELAVAELDDRRLVALRIEGAEGPDHVLVAELDWPFRGGRGRVDPRRLADRNREGSEDAGSAAGASDPSDAAGPPAVARDRQQDSGRTAGFRRGSGGRTPQRWYTVWLAAIDQPGPLALRMIAILLTAGLLCYGLARYLTAPVLRLRDATHRLAGGDLSVRVGSAVARRGDELAELGRDFDLMAARIESLLTSQRQLLSDVSHELRSPLARLNVALALARRRSGPEAEGALDRIESEAEQLNTLVGRVLALARLESRAVELDLADLDLQRLVADIVADAEFEAEPEGVSVRFTASSPCRVRGDEALLRSAIENVVRNAVRYTAPGTAVEISMEQEAGARASMDGSPAASTGAGHALITVRDHGPGVPEERIDRLFEPFYRIADARDRQSGGTGLGLSITERAVRLHGGSVHAVNVDGGGLQVEIRLPLGRR